MSEYRVLFKLTDNLQRLIGLIKSHILDQDYITVMQAWQNSLNKMLNENEKLEKELVETLKTLNEWNMFKNSYPKELSHNRDYAYRVICTNFNNTYRQYKKVAEDRNGVIFDMYVMVRKFLSMHDELIGHIHPASHNLFSNCVMSWYNLFHVSYKKS
jgi:hypothetical protein